jgi:Ca2+-binding RTX toxin-like protein
LNFTCPALTYLGWNTHVGNPGLNAHVWDLVGVDAGGAIPRGLYAAGNFTQAGGQPVPSVARWDGTSWFPVNGSNGGGPNNIVEALALGPDGQLYAGGDFSSADGLTVNYIARWDGTNWHALAQGVDNSVFDLIVYDDGGGPNLYLGGAFHSAGSLTVDHIARWDGASFSALGGSGVGPGEVDSLWVHQDKLIIGGQILNMGGISVTGIGAWDGNAFSPLGAGVWPLTLSMASYAGLGLVLPPARLYVGGNFTQAGGNPANHIASWDGANWNDLKGGTADGAFVEGLFTADVGDGERLYVAGNYDLIGGTSALNVSRWNGSSYQSMLGGLGPPDVVLDATIHDTHGMRMTTWDDGSGDGTCLFVSGVFDTAGKLPAHDIARYCCQRPYISFSPLVYEVDLGTIPLVFRDQDGDGLPESVECNDTTYDLRPGSVLQSCGVCIAVGTAGDDNISLATQACPAVLFGGPGNDTLVGTQQGSALFGADGNDMLVGGAGEDQLVGGPGRDVLRGGDGDDALGGGPDDDRLEGGTGRDLMDGGDGNDSAIVDSAGDLTRAVETTQSTVAAVPALGHHDATGLAALLLCGVWLALRRSRPARHSG